MSSAPITNTSTGHGQSSSLDSPTVHIPGLSDLISSLLNAAVAIIHLAADRMQVDQTEVMDTNDLDYIRFATSMRNSATDLNVTKVDLDVKKRDIVVLSPNSILINGNINKLMASSEQSFADLKEGIDEKLNLIMARLPPRM
ncbi:hypothetical protein CspHIS471_0503800 [Cutaneotrichosporon sp. HIS471]|nr:hypothetical protein CspHIS471_0503800 [Cutaneotrichosporon sp. HIS471]